MEVGTLPKLNELLRVPVGAARYGMLSKHSDSDVFILTPTENLKVRDREANTSYFVWSVPALRYYWGHPVSLGDLTGDCTGDERLVSFLRSRRYEVAYGAPERTAAFGLDYIAVGERYGYNSPIKAGLRTAMILSHMAAEVEDPFLLSDEEKATLIRARTGEVKPEERVEVYRRTLSPENLNKLRRMPENVTVKNELFVLLDEICKEETQ